jgi:ElaB/YqjD/DUF883 family membrane-anchored ribosome-binding protein
MTEAVRPQDKFRDKLTETRENIADMGHLAKETLQDKLHELKDRAAESYADGKEKLQDIEKSLALRVAESPMKAVLIAAGVGLALGLLWRRS